MKSSTLRNFESIYLFFVNNFFKIENIDKIRIEKGYRYAIEYEEGEENKIE